MSQSLVSVVSFNRESAMKQAAKNGRRDAEQDFGTNPCSEIILRSREFCNLSEVVVRPTDTRETLMEKVRLATILGTIQSTLVNFKYVSSVWRNNCEEERLLGVSLTGIMDNKLLNGKGSVTHYHPYYKTYEMKLLKLMKSLQRKLVSINLLQLLVLNHLVQ